MWKTIGWLWSGLYNYAEQTLTNNNSVIKLSRGQKVLLFQSEYSFVFAVLQFSLTPSPHKLSAWELWFTNLIDFRLAAKCNIPEFLRCELRIMKTFTENREEGKLSLSLQFTYVVNHFQRFWNKYKVLNVKVCMMCCGAYGMGVRKLYVPSCGLCFGRKTYVTSCRCW